MTFMGVKLVFLVYVAKFQVKKFIFYVSYSLEM